MTKLLFWEPPELLVFPNDIIKKLPHLKKTVWHQSEQASGEQLLNIVVKFQIWNSVS